ncbi:site-specific integrase [Glacieibacterium frigidum]|uniref:Phage integrase family protein n=1 Tax=Glacieibacterium frigidum TaxID=2593303 RepID=A0A552UHQ6_9SPHN|nr:hypothetical protein [Glacieibacterium frigidum]TRW17721.1 hypothetical protein FMM06_06170 [Glacieibacterium frigidum]
MAASYLYRRNGIYWWRRVLPLYPGRSCDIRLSLRTVDRRQAVTCSALLVAAVQEIEVMMTAGMRDPCDRPDTEELEKIYRQSVKRRAAEIIDDQRRRVSDVDLHRASNTAHIDYFQRLADTNGHPDLTADDVTALRDAGWTVERISRLAAVISLYSPTRPAISMRFVDAALEQAGFVPHNGIRGMVQRTMYLAGRDACQEANDSLDQMNGERLTAPALRIDLGASPMSPEQPHATVRENTSDVAPTSADGAPLKSAHNGAELSQQMLVSEAMILCIAHNTGPQGWSADTKKQVRQAIDMFIFAIGGDLPVAHLRQTHLGELSQLFGKLPNRYGRTTAELKGGFNASLIRAQSLPSSEVGIKQVTRNKHLTWVSKVIRYATSQGHRPAEPLDFSELRRESKSVNAKIGRQLARDKRAAWTPDEVNRMLSAPIWFGCHSPDDRFQQGNVVVHDAWYWAPLLAVLYGGRSSETVALALSEIFETDPIPYFSIEFTEIRALKTAQSKRKLPIHPELIRLGFVEYVSAMRTAGHEYLFPELHSPKSKSFASTFYKSIFKQWRDWGFPEGTAWRHKDGGITKDKDVHAFRGTASSAMIGLPDVVRYYILGHEGTNTTTITYDEVPLDKTLKGLRRLTKFTKHIPRQTLVLRPIDRQKFGKLRGRRTVVVL